MRILPAQLYRFLPANIEPYVMREYIQNIVCPLPVVAQLS